MKMNSRTKSEGELLARRMSAKALQYYSENESIEIHANDRDDETGIYVSFDFGQSFSEVSFSELESDFEQLQAELDEMEA